MSEPKGAWPLYLRVEARVRELGPVVVAFSGGELWLAPAVMAAKLLRNIDTTAGIIAAHILPEVGQLQSRAN